MTTSSAQLILEFVDHVLENQDARERLAILLSVEAEIASRREQQQQADELGAV